MKSSEMGGSISTTHATTVCVLLSHSDQGMHVRNSTAIPQMGYGGVREEVGDHQSH